MGRKRLFLFTYTTTCSRFHSTFLFFFSFVSSCFLFSTLLFFYLFSFLLVLFFSFCDVCIFRVFAYIFCIFAYIFSIRCLSWKLQPDSFNLFYISYFYILSYADSPLKIVLRAQYWYFSNAIGPKANYFLFSPEKELPFSTKAYPLSRKSMCPFRKKRKYYNM